MKKHLSWIAAVGFIASLIVVVPAAFAQTPNGMHGGWGGMRGRAPAADVFGTVTAVNGNTITVTSKSRLRPESSSVQADGGADESAEMNASVSLAPSGISSSTFLDSRLWGWQSNAQCATRKTPYGGVFRFFILHIFS